MQCSGMFLMKISRDVHLPMDTFILKPSHPWSVNEWDGKIPIKLFYHNSFKTTTRFFVSLSLSHTRHHVSCELQHIFIIPQQQQQHAHIFNWKFTFTKAFQYHEENEKFFSRVCYVEKEKEGYALTHPLVIFLTYTVSHISTTRLILPIEKRKKSSLFQFTR